MSLVSVTWKPSKKPGAVWTPKSSLISSKKKGKPTGSMTPDVPVLHLAGGWVFTPVADEMNGRIGWAAHIGGQTSDVTHLGDFPEDPIRPRCASILTTLKAVRLNATNPIIHLSAMCEEEGIDILSSQEYVALLSVHATQRKVDVLWSGRGSGFTNESLGSAEWMTYEVMAGKDGMALMEVKEVCEYDEGAADGRRCSSTKAKVKTLPYP